MVGLANYILRYPEKKLSFTSLFTTFMEYVNKILYTKGSYIFNTFAIRPDIVSTEIVQSIQMVHLHDLTPFHYRMYVAVLNTTY